VECKIFSKSKKHVRELSLVIDTGAASTSLPRNLTEALGYSPTGKEPRRTATGIVTLDNTLLSRIELGGEFAFSNLIINILDWEDSSFHGVIGMDILSKLHFHSDTKSLTIQLKPFVFGGEELRPGLTFDE
jgi:predicted aspartyl protease